MRVLIFIVFLSVIAYSQSTKNPVATAPGSDMPPIEPGVSQELARWRAAHYSDVRYKLNLTLEKMSPVLKGTMEIRVKLSEPPASVGGQNGGDTIPPIILDWRKTRGHEKKSTVSNVSVNGKVVSISTNWPPANAGGSDFREHLIFRDGVFTGENVIKLDFTSPILTSGSAITRYVDKEDGSEYIYSLFVPSDASTAFPVFDQPDLKAKFTLEVTSPHFGWKVVSNTLGTYRQEVGATPEGQNITEAYIHTFPETKPISTYVFAFAAGPWERVSSPHVSKGSTQNNYKKWTKDDVSYQISFDKRQPQRTQNSEPLETSIYVRKSQAAKFKPHAAEVFRLNREAVKYFDQYFDYKFPFPKYDLVLIPEFPFGGMEHAGATFLRESSIIFPQEPTKNDHISRATLIFHEAAHQWFGDTVTMRWFDDLWLKEGFATFMGYKALERVMPEMNAWKVFYERVKQGAYQTDSTKGTTPIYQEIKNLSAAKSAYGAIVYNKAPAFLRQAEFYLGEDKFQTAVRAFLKKHEYANAGWQDLVKEFVNLDGEYAGGLATKWVEQRGMPKFTYGFHSASVSGNWNAAFLEQSNALGESDNWWTEFNVLTLTKNELTGEYERRIIRVGTVPYRKTRGLHFWNDSERKQGIKPPDITFPNYGDYGYGIFLLNERSRDYVLKNIQNEKDPFLRSMMWGALWDSVREGELDPREYVELVVKVLSKSNAFTREKSITPEGVTLTDDESTTALLLSRVGTAMNYYLSEPSASADGSRKNPSAHADGTDTLRDRVENLLIERMQNAPTLGQRITFYRALLNIASSENARNVLKAMLKSVPSASADGSGRDGKNPSAHADGTDKDIPLKTKDKFDIVTRLLILNDPDAPKLLADLEKVETSDDAKRYAYAAKAGTPTADSKAKFWNDFTNNKEISESWIEAAFGPWNSIRHSELTVGYLQKALQELPNHKRNRKIFFVNGWLGAFIGGQRSEEALTIVNKFLADNPKLDNDLRLKILENVDLIERAVRIRSKFKGN